ncbi:MAG: orotate phosphoribosyltransferase [Geminicoccaceae bacterium]
MSLTRDAVLDEFRAAGALLEGHFILTSGRRSPYYLQCARVLMDPARAERLCTALAARIRELQAGQAIDAVVAPAMGGILVGYELARALGCLSLFTERVEGRFTLRRGFALEPGDRVLIAEDVVTTGLSLRECADAVRATGAVVVGAAALIDRSNGRADIGMKLTALATVDFPTFAPEEVPADLAAIPATKPGSRGLK